MAEPPRMLALAEEEPLAAFAGIWTAGWRGMRKVKKRQVGVDLFAFLTTQPNAELARVHPKVTLRTEAEREAWLSAPWPGTAPVATGPQPKLCPAIPSSMKPRAMSVMWMTIGNHW